MNINQYEQPNKLCVKMTTQFNTDGSMYPVEFEWESDDGKVIIPIERIVRIERAAALKAGGVGIRYTVVIAWNNRNLKKEIFYEICEQDKPEIIGRWFVERK